MVLHAEPSKLLVHQIASQAAVDAVALARCFRGPGRLARGDQLVRAALSIASNIAEACGRGTVPEFRRFLLYARGSAHELLSQLRIAQRLAVRHDPRIRALESRTILITKMLGRLYAHPPPDR